MKRDREREREREKEFSIAILLLFILCWRIAVSIAFVLGKKMSLMWFRCGLLENRPGPSCDSSHIWLGDGWQSVPAY